MIPRILTIQDISCVGQCSITVALPVISACGVECAVLPSAVLSNHTGTGFPSWTFCDLTNEISNCAEKWNELNIKFDAFYTGYVTATQIDAILSLMEKCAAKNALRIVDPVMGDNGKMYAGFDSTFPQKMKKLCENADYILPNLTEAAFLLGEKPRLENYDQYHIENTIKKLHSLGAKNVVLTGVSFDESKLGCAISNGKEIVYDFNDRLRHKIKSNLFSEDLFHGTGDLFSSVFAGAIMREFSIVKAAELAGDIVYQAIDETPENHWYGVAFERTLGKLANAFN